MPAETVISAGEAVPPAARIAVNLAAVRLRIAAAARDAGRDPAGIELVAVAKGHPAALAQAALAAGHRVFGENRVQEAAAKWPGYTIVKEKVTFPREALAAGYDALDQDLGAASKDESDGLRLAWPDKRVWLHVRPSGTEPVVRLIAEAPDERRARELVKRAAEVLAGVV